MSKTLKHIMAARLADDLRGEAGLLLLDPGPMTVEEASALREDLRERAGGARLRVIHNRTARVALQSLYVVEGDETLQRCLRGPTAIAYGGAGTIPIAKVIREWKRRRKPVAVKGAIAEGRMLGAEAAEGLADLPDLPTARAMLLAALLGAPRGIAIALSSVYGGLARCLQARVEQESQATTASESPEAPAA